MHFGEFTIKQVGLLLTTQQPSYMRIGAQSVLGDLACSVAMERTVHRSAAKSAK